MRKEAGKKSLHVLIEAVGFPRVGIAYYTSYVPREWLAQYMTDPRNIKYAFNVRKLCLLGTTKTTD